MTRRIVMTIIWFAAVVGLAFFGKGLFVREQGTKGAQETIRAAIARFHADTGVYPATLLDLTATNGKSVQAPITPGRYQGPYLKPGGGIDGTGIPANPRAKAGAISLIDHWNYCPADGHLESRVLNPGEQAHPTHDFWGVGK
jgi:hypothetical protein